MSEKGFRGAAVVASAVLTALVLWALLRLAGLDLEVGWGESPSQVGALDVLVATLLGGMGAWAVHGLLARRGRARRWWPVVGSTGVAISVIGPSWLADGSAAVALIGMHLAVGFMLISGFRRHVSPSCRDGQPLPQG